MNKDHNRPIPTQIEEIDLLHMLSGVGAHAHSLSIDQRVGHCQDVFPIIGNGAHQHTITVVNIAAAGAD